MRKTEVQIASFQAWALNLQGRVNEPAGVDQGRAKRDADFYLPLNLKRQYTGLAVQGIARVNDRDAYEVVGTPQGDVPERLYFDAVTGLLLRKASFLPTPAGPSPYEVNFEDYRDTGSGTKFPYLITMNPPGARTVVYGSSTLRVTKVQDNAPLDNAKFAKPQPRPGRGAVTPSGGKHRTLALPTGGL